MKRSIRLLLARNALGAALWACVAGNASAAITALTNADFEDPGPPVVDQDVPGWFDYASGNGDVIQTEDANATAEANVPKNTIEADKGWLNLVDNIGLSNVTGVYQSFGTHDAGITSYQVDFTVGQRSDTEGFDDVIVEIYYGSATGANGTPITSLGLSLLGSYTITGSDYFATPTTKGTAFESLSFDATALADGDMLWLSFREDDDDLAGGGSQQSLIDDVSVTAIPEPSVALLGVLGLTFLLRRRRWA